MLAAPQSASQAGAPTPGDQGWSLDPQTSRWRVLASLAAALMLLPLGIGTYCLTHATQR